ncbi:RNA polymerase sigma factor SigJ [Chitinivorax sp. B]|uniref:RNA polymerase sigma factor SigJ n=1 Tax=Chitinivorax sp. B TaxID=2502235 RepID=UPI0014850108|nr:RNA polymerase sigma factor SigJ [Chitinivorax sp. B]
MTAHLQAFMAQRPMLRRLAYRMLGDIALADDAVQDAYLRWHDIPLSTIDNPQAWLVTTVSRLCLDRLRASRAAREQYHGEWLPTPVVEEADAGLDPLQALQTGSAISLALMTLLEQLSPDERVAFIMQEVFDHDYSTIANVLGKTEAACRQLVRRAKQRLSDGQARFQAQPARKQALLGAFLGALAQGSLNELLATLAPDVALRSDGGGVVKAASKPVFGPRAVSRLLLGIRRVLPENDQVGIEVVNGEPVLVGRQGTAIRFVLALAFDEAGISGLYLVNNPAKLTGLA